MKVTNPEVHFDIDFTAEEIETVEKALKVFKNIWLAMDKRDCFTLEGGYEETPTLFAKSDIKETVAFLSDFCENIPSEMY